MGKKVDLTGQRFGKLVVVKDVGRKNGTVLWECVCECGSHVNVISTNLQCGNSKSCGCARMKDLSNQQFGRLVVLNPTNKRTDGSVVWMCKCDCGNYTEVSAKSLLSGHTKSCGCLLSENLEGKRYGKLLVVEGKDERRDGNVLWNCLCDCGNHTKVVASSLASGVTKSCGCLRNRLGVDHPNYNPDITDEQRSKFRYVLHGGNSKVWSQQTMIRDDFTCQICNKHGGNLNAHHLNGWNAFPEQRFDVDNGVTLCTDCHKEFHSEYGYGDNTREQFDEYAASKTLVLN